MKTATFPALSGFMAGLWEALEWPLLRWLKPQLPVQVIDPERLGGQTLAARHVACCLPAQRVLIQNRWMPDLAADELEQALAMEVERISPFGLAQTVWGWRYQGRGEQGAEVRLALAARHDVGLFVADLPVSLQSRTEVWAECSPPLALRGYGEVHRIAAIKRSVYWRVGLLLAVVLGFLVLVVTPFMQTRAMVLDAQERFQVLTQSAARAITERDSLMYVQRVGEAVREHRQRQAEVLPLLEALSETIPDTVYAVSLVQKGSRVGLTGEGLNTSALVGMLGGASWVTGFRTIGAITRMNEQGVERFSVEFQFHPTEGDK